MLNSKYKVGSTEIPEGEQAKLRRELIRQKQIHEHLSWQIRQKDKKINFLQSFLQTSGSQLTTIETQVQDEEKLPNFQEENKNQERNNELKAYLKNMKLKMQKKKKLIYAKNHQKSNIYLKYRNGNNNVDRLHLPVLRNV